jgi:hypothetical protein
LPRAPGWHLCAVPVLRMKPGDFALGSGMSRAAARAELERRFAGRIARTVIVDLETDCTEPRIGEWREGADGSLGRVCALPKGMTMQEAERIVSQPGWKPTAPPAKPERARPPLKPEWGV